jgi:hypothetical protein
VFYWQLGASAELLLLSSFQKGQKHRPHRKVKLDAGYIPIDAAAMGRPSARKLAKLLPTGR